MCNQRGDWDVILRSHARFTPLNQPSFMFKSWRSKCTAEAALLYSSLCDLMLFVCFFLFTFASLNQSREEKRRMNVVMWIDFEKCSLKSACVCAACLQKHTHPPVYKHAMQSLLLLSSSCTHNECTGAQWGGQRFSHVWYKLYLVVGKKKIKNSPQVAGFSAVLSHFFTDTVHASLHLQAMSF